MLDSSERQRLAALYERLRLNLLDLTRRNRMLSYTLGARSKRHIQFVDEVLEETYRKLAIEEASLRILSLQEPDEIPRDEQTEEFIAALEHAKVSNVEYLTTLEALESQGRDDEITLARLERDLRDSVRAELGLSPRPKKAEISRTEHARSLGIDPNPELQPGASKPSHSDDALQTLHFPDDLERVIDKIKAEVRLSEQEMGLSTLFLAFGFLEWYDSDASDSKAFAPLLLLPVSIKFEKFRGHEISYLYAREATAESNLSLRKLLQTRFNRTLPDFESQDEDTAGSIEGYLQRVRDAVEGLPRWQVHRWLVLGHFAFGRFAMYADLDVENWSRHPVDNPLVSSILRGTETAADTAVLTSIPEDYCIDEPEIEAIAPYLIQDADASQHSALIDVMKGKNLVIQGPPGTGKSQTITNIIANALAANKTVLFLAEKQAALEVVKRRLVQAGLGEFCLEVHSDKASSKAVIESLKQRMGLDSSGADASPQTDIAWLESRKELSQYLTELNRKREDGTTLFQMIWKALRGRGMHAGVIDKLGHVALPEQIFADQAQRAAVESRLEVLASASASFSKTYGPPSLSPWAALDLEDLPNAQVRTVLDLLQDFREVNAEIKALVEGIGLEAAEISALDALISIDASLDVPRAAELLDTINSTDLDELERALELVRDWCRAGDLLAAKPDLAGVDIEILSIASALISGGLPPGLAACTPAQFYEQAESQVRRAEAALALCDRAQPLVTAAGLDHQVQAGAVVPLAVATRAVASLNAEQRACMSVYLDVDSKRFAEYHNRWTAIVAAEKSWRARLASYGQGPWPEAGEIAEAAAVLSQSGPGRILAALTGKMKSAKEFAARLGLSVSAELADELARLSAHVRAVREFEHDADAADTLGSAWDGLLTPFPWVATALRVRSLFLDHIGPLPHGAFIVQRIMQLPEHALSALAAPRNVDLALEVCALAGDLREDLDDRPLHELRDSALRQVAAMKSFLRLDPKQSLSRISLPIREIAEVAQLRTVRDDLATRLNLCRMGQLACDLASSTDDVDRAQSAIDWVRQVSKLKCPPPLDTMLLSARANEVREQLRTQAARAAELRTRYRATVDALRKFGLEGLARRCPAQVLNQLDKLLEHRDELSELLAIHRYRRELIQLGLGSFLHKADEARVEPSRLPSLFQTIVVDHVARKLAGAPEISTHAGTTLEARRRQFAERDRRKIATDRSVVRAKLLEKQGVPGSNYGPNHTWTEMALLRREFTRQGRFTPLRNMIQRAGRSLQALMPCFMMSPLSLAKFVAPNTINFDLLIIDEASQMKPEDALGGLLRAKQVVVVGDQKQLPPTDFFNRSADASDDMFEDEDDESILDACQKAFRQVRRLRWHYRSRCESLIRFSNENFYRDSPLITFPAAKPGAFSIDLVRVDGEYQARRNVSEASRIAQDAIAFMRWQVERNEHPIPTLGIVSLNIEQRELIREELQLLSAGDPLVEQYMEHVASLGEPLFVKNLENVQGDERDFILISMTYGKEPGATRMAQRFGPISGRQGHRRLNVLFTRARRRIALFTSFGSTDVVLSESGNEGPRILKSYLEYAERRGGITGTGGNEPDSEFEQEVADRLRSKGYQVDVQVGVSGFRIDIGIRHPDHPERFLAGVECDGARFHSTKSARDRDRLREEILAGLGWRLLRVWSTDWFENPARETDKLVKRLEELRSTIPPLESDYPRFGATIDFAAESGPTAGGTSAVAKSVEANVDDARSSEREALPPSITAPTDTVAVEAEEGQPLSAEAVGQKLREFRETVIRAEMPNWKPQRSILREAMIETFVSQRLSDPDDWFARVPAYLRVGTDPNEKRRYLGRICDIVARLEPSIQVASRIRADGLPPTPKSGSAMADQGALPLSVEAPDQSPKEQEHSENGIRSAGSGYTVTEFANAGIRMNSARFYEPDYRPVLRSMVERVVRTEGPIYEDVLVDRIARAHGFQRSGNMIYQTIVAVVSREYSRSSEFGRTVIWPIGAQTNRAVPYRSGGNSIRSHGDIPVAELASLAKQFLARRLSNENVLKCMADHFGLTRLRETTRIRFEKAIEFARQSPPV